MIVSRQAINEYNDLKQRHAEEQGRRRALEEQLLHLQTLHDNGSKTPSALEQGREEQLCNFHY